MDHIREQLKQFISNIGHSQATVAKEIGVSEATLSQFLSDTYKGNNEILCKKVEEFIKTNQKRLMPPTPPEFVITSTVKDIWYAVKYAHMRHDISLVYGDAGRGKSKALKEYALRNERVIYIEADATIQNTKSVLEEIWKTIGKRNPEPERYMKEGIIDELRNSEALIIIDEANQLNYKALEAIRVLNDKGGIGIVLAGSSYIFEKMNGRNEILYAQIISRIGMRKHLFGNIPKDDIESILKERI